MISKTFLVFLIVYFLSDFSIYVDGLREEMIFRDNYKYIEKLKSHYKIHMTPLNFTDAKQMCGREGATLFYPKDAEEANTVIAYWTGVQPTGDWSVIVGLTDSETEGEFKTIDGKPISDVYEKWHPGEPNNGVSLEEDCIQLYRNGKMNDIACDLTSRFICKKDYTKTVDSYYKIYMTPRTFAEANRLKQVLLAFETIDGKLIYDVYDHWLEVEPNNMDGSRDCIQLNRQGCIDDISCDKKYGFICKNLPASQWNYNCNIADLDYTFNENLGKCYKLHTTPLNWTEAYDMCRAEHSYLVVINNTLEAHYLQELTTSAAKRMVEGTYQKGIYHVGVHNRLNEGWQTVTGKSINDTSAWWSNYQPPTDDERKCGSMFYTGLLINIDCNSKIPFICEHDIDIIGVTDQSKFSSDNEENYQ